MRSGVDKREIHSDEMDYYCTNKKESYSDEIACHTNEKTPPSDASDYCSGTYNEILLKIFESDAPIAHGKFKVPPIYTDDKGVVFTPKGEKGIEKMARDRIFTIDLDEAPFKSTDPENFLKRVNRLKKYHQFISNASNYQSPQDTYCGFKPGFLIGKRF